MGHWLIGLCAEGGTRDGYGIKSGLGGTYPVAGGLE